MKIIRFYDYGGPDVLKLEEADLPRRRANEILLKTEVIGVNYTDIAHRNHVTREEVPLPYTPGVEVVGTIIEAAEGVAHLPIGTKVIALIPHGGYAEYLALPPTLVLPVPAGMDIVQAVALPLQGLTAYHILDTFGRLKPGERVLIQAAAGGVGTLAVQLAKVMGAGQIIAIASTQEKLDFARSLGADAGVNYTQQDWAQQALEVTEGKGVDLILDMRGGAMFSENFTCLAPLGRIVTFGAASGQRGFIDPEKLTARCHTVTGYYAGFISTRPDLIGPALKKLFHYTLTSQLKPQVKHHFPLEEAAEAHRQMENRQTTGKIVLFPTGQNTTA